MALTNAVAGGLIFYYIIAIKLKRHRTKDEALEKQFAAFNEQNIHNYNLMTLFAGAITMMLPRFALFLVDILGLTVVLVLLTLGHDFRKPLPRWRRSIAKLCFSIAASIQTLSLGLFLRSEKEESVDYSEWLGADYKNSKLPEGKKCPTIVANHSGWNDILVMLIAFWGDVSFVAGEFVDGIFPVNRLAVISESILVPRSGDQKQRDRAINIIGNRQRNVMDGTT